jgi:recombination protein RecA
MSQALRKLAGAINRSNCSVVFINQLREKIGVMFGNPETTTGGKALKFYASLRLDIRRIGPVKEKEAVIGNHVRVKVVKNKVAPPFRQAEFDIIYGEGISHEGNLLDLGVERGMVQKSGAYFSFGDERLGQGRHAARAFLKENTDIAERLEAQIRADAGVGGGPATPAFDPETGEILEPETPDTPAPPKLAAAK